MPERGLRKGAGFHWDLLLVGLCSVVSALFGAPWTCAAAVQSLAHCSSLTVFARHAPGERAHVDHVIEQRLTALGVALLTGDHARGLGKNPWGGGVCLYLHVIRFDFDSGVGIPVTLTFWPWGGGGKLPSKPPPPNAHT